MARPKKPRDEKFCYEVKTYVRISTGVALEEYARKKHFDGISQAARELLEIQLAESEVRKKIFIKQNEKEHFMSIKKEVVMVSAAALVLVGFSGTAFAQISTTAITSGMGSNLKDIWAIAKWVMQAILVLVAAIMAFKTATSGGHDKTGGWIAVIGTILLAIGLNFVPDVASALFGITLK